MLLMCSVTHLTFTFGLKLSAAITSNGFFRQSSLLTQSLRLCSKLAWSLQPKFLLVEVQICCNNQITRFETDHQTLAWLSIIQLYRVNYVETFVANPLKPS